MLNRSQTSGNIYQCISDIVFFSQKVFQINSTQKIDNLFQSTMQNSPAIKLGTGTIRYECPRCGFKVIIPSIDQRLGCDSRKKMREVNEQTSAIKSKKNW